MPPGPRYIPTAEWNSIVAAQMPQTPTVRPLEPEPTFLNRAQTWGIGSPAPMVNGHFVGDSSPATWSPMGFLSGAPRGAYAAAPVLPQDAAVAKLDAPQAPTLEEARVNQGPAPAGGWPALMGERIASAMGSDMSLPDQTHEVIGDLNQYRAAVPGIGNIHKPPPALTDAGLQLMVSGADERAAGLRNEAENKAKEEAALSGFETERGNRQEAWGIEDAKSVQHMGDRISEDNKKADEDRAWLRKHPRVDPYEMFRSNAGAGIFAALGSALMATGASLRKDSSLSWTKQIDNMLDRESEIQLREIQNHRGTLNDAQANIKRILETSKDMDEAKARFRNQGLESLNSKILAIKHATESKSVAERADALIAANKEQMGKNIADVGIRREGLESQEAIARLMAGVQGRGQELNLAGILAGLKAAEREKVLQVMATANRPRLEADLKLKELHSRAMTTGRAFFDALEHKQDFDAVALNTLSEAFTGATKAFLEGADRPGEANEVRAFGVTLDPTKLLGKFNRYDAKGVSAFLDTINNIRDERRDAIWHNTEFEAPIPPGSKFHKTGKGK